MLRLSLFARLDWMADQSHRRLPADAERRLLQGRRNGARRSVRNALPLTLFGAPRSGWWNVMKLHEVHVLARTVFRDLEEIGNGFEAAGTRKSGSDVVEGDRGDR